MNALALLASRAINAREAHVTWWHRDRQTVLCHYAEMEVRVRLTSIPRLKRGPHSAPVQMATPVNTVKMIFAKVHIINVNMAIVLTNQTIPVDTNAHVTITITVCTALKVPVCQIRVSMEPSVHSTLMARQNALV